MAYIQVIHEDEAEGKLFSIYDDIQKSRGRLSNVLRIQSLDPQGLKAHLDLYMAHIYRAGGLSRMERELLAVIVSRANGCDYCVTHHSEALSKYVKDAAWVASVGKEPASVDMEPRQAALRAYALGLTTHAGTGRKEAVGTLRAAGFSDEEILHATEVVAYFNYVNRLVSGLGVELEDDEDRDYAY